MVDQTINACTALEELNRTICAVAAAADNKENMFVCDPPMLTGNKQREINQTEQKASSISGDQVALFVQHSCTTLPVPHPHFKRGVLSKMTSSSCMFLWQLSALELRDCRVRDDC
jgi:hypothetical protein